ncbi:MAG: aminoacyl-tRNA hydrolase [Eubacteriaceae bacterium]|nr:aminoacyl-tRNA hydrolase [Eubacteriaceae bacterium]
MYLIAGLGNPGRKFEKTKHNMGFMVLDEFARRRGAEFSSEKFDALYTRADFDGKRVLLIKPQTFMNLSGDAVAAFADYFDVDPSELLVVYDDCEIDMGTIRIRRSGSAGTHNGMRDIVSKLGYTDFPRMRMGIGSRGEMQLYDYVLTPFSEQEFSECIAPAVQRACDALECFLSEGTDIMMNRFNTPKKKKAKEPEEVSQIPPEDTGEESLIQ